MIGVLGGNFALYGWLPALCQFYPNETILIESRHKEKFNNRPELQQYKDRIKWVTTKKLFNESELVIIAIPPDKVFNYLSLINQSLSIKRIIVEKPICEDPDKSERFINVVEQKGIKICSSYLFLYTDWAKDFVKDKISSIQWYIDNKNPKNSWKWENDLGGGMLKFYGIHLLALASYFNLKLKKVEFKEYSKKKYLEISFDKLSIQIQDDSEYPSFRIAKNDYLEDLKYPFPNRNLFEDDRIPYLINLLEDFNDPYEYEKLNILMKKTNQLWKQVEEKLK